MAYSESWDEGQPLDTQPARLLGEDIRDMKTAISERVASFGAGVIADRQTPEAEFEGVIYFATDESKLYRWNGSSWDDITVEALSTFVSSLSGVFGFNSVRVGVFGASFVPGAIFEFDGIHWQIDHFTDGTFRIYQPGELQLLVRPRALIADETTSLDLDVKSAGVHGQFQVLVGAADSGGAGYRMLRIAN